MKFLVISDTHGRLGPAEEIYRSLSGIDRVIHLGDYDRDGQLLANKIGVPVIALKGNMDGSYSKDDYRILETEYGKIYLTHGHVESVKQGPENLIYKASSLGCRAALFGHTHVPVFEECEGIYLLNPGSLTDPRGGKTGSYAVMTTGHGSFSATIIYLDPVPKKGPEDSAARPKQAAETGFLRGRFIDSDGQ